MLELNTVHVHEFTMFNNKYQYFYKYNKLDLCILFKWNL